jgi:hypothetical protein
MAIWSKRISTAPAMAPQPVDVLRDIALLDGRPFGDLHTGQAGGLLDGKALSLAD